MNRIADIPPSDVNAADTVYIADKHLNVIYTNGRWESFALNNGGDKILDPGWDSNILENVSGKEKERWKHIYRLLLEDRIPLHKENFICSSPLEKRIYQLRITPRKDDDGKVAWLVHHILWVDESRDALPRLGKRLGDLEDPHRVTREYQQRIFMRTIRIPGFRAARHFRPLETIGGDLLWHREFPQGVAQLTHADAMGHGIAAGRLATQMAVILDEIADADLGPGASVSTLNRALLQHAIGDEVVFATGLFFRFDRSGRQLTCSNFGHHNPIFSRTGQLYIDGGPPVGLADEVEPWPQIHIDMLLHGNRFLVFSDGITEQFNIEGEMFDTQRLLDAFQRHLELPLDKMIAAIIGELNHFRGPALVKDDQTLLALEFIGDKTEVQHK
ncbi:MAG: PP2C family protein-serine/threonine phosphatase [Desulfobacterales bacterium]|nr:PP2C family protein-serine/threonine phosphatase [Desulfobacterales bacterium]